MAESGVIPIALDTATGNVRPLLHEIRHALTRLLNTGEPTVIDLGALPLSETELEQLQAQLGKGEVRAELHALGVSLIQETRYSGVWLIRHMNESQESAGMFIEISKMPELLYAQMEDIQDGLGRLEHELNEQPPF
ncbi:MAG TPA: hypothetical protein EYH06_01715 [Chromatiales bacterium]|nr:hypothetical protein [Thiotrichales bacterium]HIP67292.1 hypothetical protein [Chromatiales bacterium]